MKQITALVFAVLIGIAIGAGMGNPSAQQPCASPSPTPEAAGDVTPAPVAPVVDMSLTSDTANGQNTITIKSPTAGNCVEAEFEPATDITAYELAQLLPYITQGECMTECGWKEAGALTRHLKRKVKEPGQ